MPRSRLVWLQIAVQQYRELPDDLRVVVDRRLAQLIESPTADPDADYNRTSDQWSVPLTEDGLLFYAVVHDPATVIVLRLISFRWPAQQRLVVEHGRPARRSVSVAR